MPKLTPEQIDEIAELRESGWSDGMLALRYGVSKSAINWHCLQLGINGCAIRIPATRRVGPLVTYRNGKPVRKFTPDEDAKLLDLAERISSRKAIARELGRNQRSIVARLAALARKEEAA
jgi:hypothetical protein